MDHFFQRFRNREHELEDLYKSFSEVRQKFAQLENAFEINLKCQQNRENEFNLQKFKSQELFDKFHDERKKTRTEYESRLISLSTEKDKWKRAFEQQKDAYEMCKLEHEEYVKSIKRECEEILVATRKSAEKHFHEIVKLYEEARDKSNNLQSQLEKVAGDFKGNVSRTLELANLLETLQKFDISVDVICQNTAEALKNLYKSESIYVEKLRNLRQLTWTYKKKNAADEAERNLLRQQNSVLKDIVKDLKRKLKETKRDGEGDLIPTKGMPSDIGQNKSSNYELGEQIRSVKNSGQADSRHDPRKIKANKCAIDRAAMRDGNATKGSSECEESAVKSNVPLHIETFETHLNGVRLLEHVLRLAFAQEIKLKYSPSLINQQAPIKVQFLDDDDEYLDDVPAENTIVFFLRHLERVVKMKNNGVHCAVQTKKKKFLNNCTQTAITSVFAPTRLNVGATMLNSERRAIERSLGNLERTVTDLKFNSLDKARSMVEKDGKLPRSEEFYEYIRLLTR